MIFSGVRSALHILIDITSHFYRPRLRPYGDVGPGQFSIQQRIEGRFRRVLQEVLASGEVTHVTILAHSQGTIIALDVLWLEWAKNLLAGKSVSLVTMGSPISHLYQHYFPHRYPPLFSPDGKLNRPWGTSLDVTVQRWLNVYRADDYIGTIVQGREGFPVNVRSPTTRRPHGLLGRQGSAQAAVERPSPSRLTRPQEVLMARATPKIMFPGPTRLDTGRVEPAGVSAAHAGGGRLVVQLRLLEAREHAHAAAPGNAGGHRLARPARATRSGACRTSPTTWSSTTGCPRGGARSIGTQCWSAAAGNDLIDDATKVIPASAAPQPDKPTDQYIDANALRKTLRDVADGYRRIVTLRDRADSPCPGVPLVTHAYDLVTPRDSPARFLVAQQGPWLYPAMVAARIPQNRWNDVADFLLGELGKCLVDLEAELPNFHVALTQGRLTRAAAGTHGNSHDWANEIHPNGKGFRELGKPLADLIDALT
jgi:hypothetical protein